MNIFRKIDFYFVLIRIFRSAPPMTAGMIEAVDTLTICEKSSFSAFSKTSHGENQIDRYLEIDYFRSTIICRKLLAPFTNQTYQHFYWTGEIFFFFWYNFYHIKIWSCVCVILPVLKFGNDWMKGWYLLCLRVRGERGRERGKKI